MKNKTVHISFDDVILSLRWLRNNNPDSVFDARFFGRLKNWHDKYSAIFTLYVFEKAENFHISETPEKYYNELHRNADWLKWGFHGVSAEYAAEDCCFESAFNETCRAISEFAGNIAVSDCLRLHFFSGSAGQVGVLRDGGVKTLLCADDHRCSYDLTPEENSAMNENGSFFKSGINYQKTHLRYENIEDISTVNSILKAGRPVVVFSHEYLLEQNADKIEESLRIINENGYNYCF